MEHVTSELLEEFAERYAPAEPPRPRPAGTRQQFDIDAFVARHLQARAPVTHEGGRKWVLEECPFNAEHKAPDAAVFERADGSLGFKCFHNSCADYGWKELRARFDPPVRRLYERPPRANGRAQAEPEDEPDTEPEYEPPPTAAQWPEPIGQDAWYGIAGELVERIEPHSESDPAALLLQFLVGWGSLAGRGPYYLAEASRHHTNEFVVIVGTTSKARKGTSWDRVLDPLTTTDEHWCQNCQVFGVGSGEGLIDAVKDEDKRALVHEGEFARLLAIIEREGSTISSILRYGWDKGTLAIRTRQSRVQVLGAHMSMIGHVTRDELLRRLSDTDMANGFGNRILWTCARRSKKLPFGGGMVDYGDILQRLETATEMTRRMGDTRVNFDEEAHEFWPPVYNRLTDGRPGIYGFITSRAEPHVIRLALIYALLDLSYHQDHAAIRLRHLKAALAVWEYCAASARFIWGDSLGDPTADEILDALRTAGGTGLTRWDLINHFSRHKKVAELDRAIRVLAERALIRSAVEKTGGRPGTRYWVL